MHRSRPLACTLALALATASCASPGGGAPDRSICALVGGVLGGVTGLVIGNNGGDGDGDEKGGGAAAGALVGGALGYLLCGGESRPAAPLAARIEATPAEGAPPLDVRFEARVTPETSTARTYAWDFGDGATGQGPRTAHTYTAPGPYTARVTISDPRSPSMTASARIFVRAPAPREAQPTPAPQTRRRIVLRGIRFATGSAEIGAADQAILDLAIEQLAASPDVRVRITGHTDSRGSDAYNQALSERRAEAVLGYFTRHGIARSRLIADGQGESKPLASNDSDEGRAQNRRVELDIIE